MSKGSFQSVYAPHYDQLPKGIYWIPAVLIGAFVAILAVLCFVRTDKVVATDGYVLPRAAYHSRLAQRGFLIERRVEVGRQVRAGELLASVQLDDGSIRTFSAPHAGVVIDTQLKDVVEGPLQEGLLIASVVDPDDLRLRVELPAGQRGTVAPGAPVRYTFDTVTRAARSRVERHYINLLPDGRLRYEVYATLAPEHRRVHYLGRRLPVKLLVENVSLIDYFLID